MINVIGLTAINSIDFVNKVFDFYNSDKLFALIKKNAVNADEIRFSTVVTPNEGGGWFSRTLDGRDSDGLAQIVFTSGTTGNSKAIVLSHKNLTNTVQRLIHVMELDSSIREYVAVPVTYSFGLGRVRAVAAVGGESYIPGNGFNLDELVSMIESGEINAISAVPSQWRIVLAAKKRFKDCSKKIKWIEIGSQYMSAEEKQLLKELFPSAKIIQHYGLTEASRSTFLLIHDVSFSEMESVGQVTGSVQVRISDEGIIEVKGDNVSPGQLKAGELVALTNQDGWLSTGDKGRIENGFVYFDGRADDIINCGGVKISPEMFLLQLQKELEVSSGIDVSKFEEPVRGEGILIAREETSELKESDVESAALKVSALYDGNISSAIKIISLPQLPRTSTGKVKRSEITAFYNKMNEEVAFSKDQSFEAIFGHIFKLQKVTPNDSFESLHGDSINHVEISIEIEKKLGYEPLLWERMSISELNNLVHKGGGVKKRNALFSISSLDVSMWLRVVAILAVVLTHAGLEVVGGGTLLLTVLVGYNLARFKFSSLVNENSLRIMIPYVLKILVPYYLLAVIYFTWNRAIEWDVILLYANLLEAKITVVFPFWFVQVLVQCFIILIALTSIPVVTKNLKIKPWFFSFILMIFFIGVRLSYPLVWDTVLLNNLVPTRFIGILWIGWTAFFASTNKEKILTTIAAVLFAYIDYGIDKRALWLSLGVPLLMFLPAIPMPSIIRAVSIRIAAATFYIFIFNGLVIYLFEKILHIDSIMVSFFVALVASSVAWYVLEGVGLMYWVTSKILPKRS